MRAIVVIVFGLLAGPRVAAQAVEMRDEQVTPADGGRARAADYFRERKPARPAAAPATPGSTPRYLAVRAGSFFSDQSYKWGRASQQNRGGFDAGVDYRLGEWVNAADFNLRVNFTSFDLAEGSARKLSAQAMISFPDANSRFPLFFGVSAGPGFFIQQIKKESVLSLDYGVFAGARVFDLFRKIGVLAEFGLKNHLLLLSDGQFNGFYFNVGCAFAF